MAPSTPQGLGKTKPGRPSLAGKGVIGGSTRGATFRRHRKVIKDTIRGITKGDIRRLARRGGVKRISSSIYDEIRATMKAHMAMILNDCAIYVEHGHRKTVTVTDVIFALRRLGRPIYGFDVGTYKPSKSTKKV